MQWGVWGSWGVGQGLRDRLGLERKVLCGALAFISLWKDMLHQIGRMPPAFSAARARAAPPRVLTDDNFTSIVKAVEKGRAIYAGHHQSETETALFYSVGSLLNMCEEFIYMVSRNAEMLPLQMTPKGSNPLSPVATDRLLDAFSGIQASRSSWHSSCPCTLLRQGFLVQDLVTFRTASQRVGQHFTGCAV